MVARKNDLLGQPLRHLLAHQGEPGTYKIEHMLEALLSDEIVAEMWALPPEKHQEYEVFLAGVRDEKNIKYLKRFFEEQQDKPFTIADIAAWMIDHFAFSYYKGVDGMKRSAREAVTEWMLLVLSFVGRGLIERVDEPPHNKYRVVLADGNPLIDIKYPDDEKPPEKESEDSESTESP